MQIAILLLASGQFALRAKTSSDNPEQQIRELEEKLNGAYASNNLAAYFSYSASDFSPWLPKRPHGEVSDEDNQESDAFFKRGGVWKIIFLHYSPAPKKKAP